MPKEPFEFNKTPAPAAGAPVATDAVPEGISALMQSTNPSMQPPTMDQIRTAAAPPPVASNEAAPAPKSVVLGPDGQPRRMVQGNVSNRSNLPFRPGDDLPEPMPKGTRVQAFQAAPGDIVIGGI